MVSVFNYGKVDFAFSDTFHPLVATVRPITWFYYGMHDIKLLQEAHWTHLATLCDIFGSIHPDHGVMLMLQKCRLVRLWTDFFHAYEMHLSKKRGQKHGTVHLPGSQVLCHSNLTTAGWERIEWHICNMKQLPVGTYENTRPSQLLLYKSFHSRVQLLSCERRIWFSLKNSMARGKKYAGTITTHQ